jgi:hypothetical protein
LEANCHFLGGYDIYLYNNLDKPFSTVCTDPFYGQTSGPRPPNFSQADPKLDVECRLPKKIEKKKFHKIFFKIKIFFFIKTRSVSGAFGECYYNLLKIVIGVIRITTNVTRLFRNCPPRSLKNVSLFPKIK